MADSERAGTSQPRSARTGTDESERKRATGADQAKESTAGRNQRDGTTSGAHQKKKVSFRTDKEEENTTTGKDQLAPGEHEEECPSGEEEEVFVFEASDLEEMQQNSPRGDSDSGSEGPPSPRRSPRDRHPNHRPEYMYPIRHEVDRERMEHQQEGSDRGASGASGGFAWGSAAQGRTGRFMEGLQQQQQQQVGMYGPPPPTAVVTATGFSHIPLPTQFTFPASQPRTNEEPKYSPSQGGMQAPQLGALGQVAPPLGGIGAQQQQAGAAYYAPPFGGQFAQQEQPPWQVAPPLGAQFASTGLVTPSPQQPQQGAGRGMAPQGAGIDTAAIIRAAQEEMIP